jgi:hypothetical protein
LAGVNDNIKLIRARTQISFQAGFWSSMAEGLRYV